MSDAKKAKFAKWLAKVDAAISKKCGLSHKDLADQTWNDWFNDGMSPSAAAKLALQNEGFYE